MATRESSPRIGTLARRKFTVAAFFDYGSPRAENRNAVNERHAPSRPVTPGILPAPPSGKGARRRSTKMISCARAGMFPAGAHHTRALKSCKLCFIALRSCPATQHFTHGAKYFEKMIALFQARA